MEDIKLSILRFEKDLNQLKSFLRGTATPKNIRFDS